MAEAIMQHCFVTKVIDLKEKPLRIFYTTLELSIYGISTLTGDHINIQCYQLYGISTLTGDHINMQYWNNKILQYILQNIVIIEDKF